MNTSDYSAIVNAINDTNIVKVKMTSDDKKYFSLFDKYIPNNLNRDSKILLFAISNLDVISKIVAKNPDSKYYIFDHISIFNTINKYYNNGNMYNITIEEIFNSDMKFDCIIMNPPYGTGHTRRTLHYDITNLILTKLSSNGKCICLMPTTLIKVNSDNKKLNLIKNNFDKLLISITEFNGNDVFDTNMKEIAIWNFDIKKDKNSEIYINTLNKKEYIKTLQQFNYYCNDIDLKILNKLKSKNNIYLTKCITLNIGIKIKQNKELLLQHINKLINKVKIYNYEFFIIVNLANGSMNATWQTKKLKNYGIVNINEIKDIMLNDTSLKTFIGFKNSDINSAKNILKLLNCNCLRYILAKTQNDQNMKSRVYEYFPDIDYSNINSEQDFYTFFNITEEEQKHIEEVMKKYK